MRALLQPVPDDVPLHHNTSGSNRDESPAVPRIVLTVANPATGSSRAGFTVLQQRVPYRLSRVEIAAPGGFDSPSSSTTLWHVRTRNVRRLRFSAAADSVVAPAVLDVDGTRFNVRP